MRFKELEESALTDAQRVVYRQIIASRGGVRGPFNALLRSPGLASGMEQLGKYLRFDTPLPARLREFAIMITARHWTAQFEWHAHCKLALEAGLSPAVAEEIRLGRRPSAMQEDEVLVYEFCTELQQNKGIVSDKTFDATRQHFGEQIVMDLIGLSGFFSLVAMVLNASQQPLPAGAPTPLPPLK